MRTSATALRANLYDLLDHVAKTGEPLEITRGGIDLCIVRKVRVKTTGKKRRALRDLIVGNPDDLIHVEWPWSEGRDL